MLRKFSPKKSYFLFDNYLLFSSLSLLITGMVLQLSVSRGEFAFKHFCFLFSGVLVFFLAYSFKISLLKRLSFLIYAFALLLLVFVLLKGSQALGAQRWLCLGKGICLQPSEPAKIASILALASWLQKRPLKTIKDLVYCAIAILFLPFALIFVQPDLGTALVLASLFLGVAYWAGAKAYQLLICCSPVLIAIFSSVSFNFKLTFQEVLIFNDYIQPSCSFLGLSLIFIFWFFLIFAYRKSRSKFKWLLLTVFLVLSLLFAFIGRPFVWGLLKEYQQNRLLVFLAPHNYPLGEGYNILQSLLSIGNGGLLGQGYQKGILTQGRFVPEQHTDFIFSALAEEFGFLGVLTVLVLFLLLCFRILLLAYRTKKRFEKLVCIGIFTLFFFHIFVNISMNCSLMPVVGMPLPLLSYGGTALWVCLFALGITQRIYFEEKISK